jgi:hypothetical protein
MVWIHVLWNLYQYLWDYPISFIPQLAQGDKSRSNLKHWGGVKNHMVSTVLLDIVGNPIVHKLIVWGLFLGMVYYWVYQIKELLKSSRSYSCLSPMAKLSSCNCAVTFFAWRSQGGCMGLRAWPDAVWILWIVAKIMFNWFNPFSRLFFSQWWTFQRMAWPLFCVAGQAGWIHRGLSCMWTTSALCKWVDTC